MSEQAAVGNVTTQVAQNGSVLIKLVLFSLALGIAPLSSYYLSLQYAWNGNPTYAAITAIVVANVVLVTYIIMSVLEEQKATTRVPAKDTKKTQ